MKLIKTFVLLFFVSGLALAQNVSYEYFTRNWEKTAQRQAYFIRKITQLESDSVLYFVCDSATNGSVIKKGYYKSLNPEVEHGYFTFMSKNRNEIYTGNYNNGEMTGMWYVSDLRGNKMYEVNYDFELITVEKEQVNENDEFDDNLVKMPMFRGGDSGLLKYLLDNLVYPPNAMLHGTQGSIFCVFMIDTTGQVTNIKILNEVDKDLDKEALRVVALLPNFVPGEYEGKKVQIWFQVPIIFSLPNNRRFRF